MIDRPSRRAVMLDLDGVVVDPGRASRLGGPHQAGRALRPGAAEQLRRLAGHRLECAALTAMPPGWCEELLAVAGLSSWVSVVVARADTSRWMPSPLPVQRALWLLRWEGPAGRVAVIGGSPEAIAMGRKAQLRTVAVTCGGSSAPALADAWPDVLTVSFPDAVTAALDLTDRAVHGYASVS